MALSAFGARAADLLDSTPVAEQDFAVDGINFTVAVNKGKFDDHGNLMFVGSIATPMPFLPANFGMQLDLAAGQYRTDYTSAASGLHLFWRDPSIGMVGIYGDWVFTNPEHSGRLGAELAAYNDRVTLEVLAGVRFGQNVYTRFFDEVDLSYYFTDNFKASIGHRWNTRGHVANISFEAMAEDPALAGWSVFGEAETGQDDYSSVFGGIRYSFGTGSNNSLITRDRESGVKVRIPRSLADITLCGRLPETKKADFWHSEQDTLCASSDDLEDEEAVIEKR